MNPMEEKVVKVISVVGWILVVSAVYLQHGFSSEDFQKV